MRNHDFIQTKAHFSFNATDCLRNAYFHNDCRHCMELCPTDALVLVRHKLTLLDTECLACAACIGSCPTEALRLEGFDPNAFTLAFQQQTPLLSCQNNTPCLGVFDTHHYITMALQGEDAPCCDLSHCEACHLNHTGKVEQSIRHKITQSNSFLEAVGMHAQRVSVIEEPVNKTSDRRALFRTALTKVHDAMTEEVQEESPSTIKPHALPATLPVKYTIVKHAIQEHIERFSTTDVASFESLFFNKTIDFDACTNCGDCIQFCPTEALFATSDKQGIFFKSGHCIGCGICDDICKSNAITSVAGLDLIAVAFDRGEELVHYEMVMCHECRCPYPYKGGDPICDRCKEFTDSFENMFVLAKDQ